jgi:hypothetical protein
MPRSPFGAVAHLLPDDVRDDDHLTLLRGVLRTLATGEAEERTRVVAVDDAQWLDAGSAAVVHRAATVADVQVVLTLRDGTRAPDVIARLAATPGTVRIDLEPLTDVQVAALLERVLEGPVVVSSARRFAHLSEGNPLWLRELVRGARRRGSLTRHGRLWRLDGSPIHGPSLSEAVRASTVAWDDAVRDLVAVVALADVVGVQVLEKLFVRDVLMAADADGLLAAVPDRRRVRVRVSHPLYGEVVLADLPPLRARSLRLQLAEAIAATGGPARSAADGTVAARRR